MTNVVKLKDAKLHFGRLKLAEQSRNIYEASIPADTKLETILEPSYWAHYTRDLTPGNIIEAKCEDGSWFAWLWIMFVSTAEVRTEVLWSKHFEVSDESPEVETHYIVWKGPHKKYCVARKDNDDIIRDGLYPKSEAHNFLRRHLQELRR